MAMLHSRRNRRRRRAKTTADRSSKLSFPNWLELPRDITAAILQKLTPIEILKNVQMVCTQWQSICKDEPLLWKTIDMGGPYSCSIKFEQYDVMCRLAVDRSCGGLTDLSINRFATNQLLDYVTERCTKIQRLRLIYCYHITDEGLCNLANRLPLLEDLELSYGNNISGIVLQRFGECCPHLKSLKLNQQGSRNTPYENGEVMAIAKHMPELRHLQLFGNGMTKLGLNAILEGCPHLESLDLRQCFNIYLEDFSWSKICEERRIKHLRLPDDSTDDYEYEDTLVEDDYQDCYSPISSDDDDGPDINFYIHHYSL